LYSAVSRKRIGGAWPLATVSRPVVWVRMQR